MSSWVLALGIAAIFPALACVGAPATEGARVDAIPADPCRLEPLTGERRLTVLTYRFPATEHFAREFKSCSEVPGLDVEVLMLPPEQVKRQADLAMSSGTASPFDVFHTNPDKLAEAAARGWVLPLDDLIARHRERFQPDDIPESFWRGFSFGGHVYAIPFTGNAQILFYRRDLFERYGLQPPRTVDEWFAVAERLRGIPEVRYPLAFAPRGSLLTQEFSNALNAAGGRWYDGRGEPAFASPEGVRAIELLSRLRDFGPRGVLSFTNDDMLVALLQNQVAMANAWLSRGVEMSNPQISNVIGKIGYAPSPAFTTGGAPYASLGFDGWAIPKNARDPELAFRLIMEATDAASMRGVAEYAIPSRSSVANAPEVVDAYPWLAASRETMARGAKALPAAASFSRMSTALQPVLARGLADRRPAAEVLAEMDLAVRRLLDEQRGQERRP